ncbi:hypothetical protein AA106555_1708 [Neokomagataea thailandica NBRC 106555]|uniref:DUF4167 domain-containing protein n=2 Tax=Neokomagataea TaxID=1223423 RepID=A0A4Y6V3K3_9PROT|nr:MULTISPECIES: DUF4167 domain-containing protein [Neokomagataea]QDH23944.1 DUF4167 domain-containing protein [Neokomagataea tanensis]GBR54540.1 hypothetical protein AA106555_1708 [Neokomagataea thailandica NBRC 106555]
MNMKRMRGRQHRSGGGGASRNHGNAQTPLNRNHVFESNGPDLRVRGTSQQLFEKYLQLGRDATGTGDRILAEAYFQHAEHYFRILNAMNQAAQQSQQERAERQQQRQRAYEERRETTGRDREHHGDDGQDYQHQGDEHHGDEPQEHQQPYVENERRHYAPQQSRRSRQPRDDGYSSEREQPASVD